MTRPCLLVILLTVFACEDEPEKKTYAKFEIASPELNKTKTIWIYLPAAYGNEALSFPVIYMQDAQWIFEANANYSQEMHVDETMRELEQGGFDGAIVVGIESDEATRADDFSLYYNRELRAGGNGKAYLDFIVHTLKPKIDAEYRTKADRDHTHIMGASLGGLICFYALTEYGQVFGRAGMFSAALHFNLDSVVQKAARREIRNDARIFAVVGEGEHNNEVDFVKDNALLFEILNGKETPPDQFQLVIHADGEHKIWFWEREFPHAIDFLFR